MNVFQFFQNMFKNIRLQVRVDDLRLLVRVVPERTAKEGLLFKVCISFCCCFEKAMPAPSSENMFLSL